jgi:hypothetical protein
MPTVVERYVAATGYVRRAVGAVEKQPIAYWVRPDGSVEWYTGADKAAPFRSDLSRVEAAWLRAATEEARENAARDAEALALRAIEALPPLGCARDAGLVDIQTPGSIKAEMETTASLIAQLDTDIRASRVDAAFKTAWRAFVEEWERFYKEHTGWFDRLWYASYAKTVEYRRRALEWREKFVAIGGTPSAPADAPPKTAGERFGDAFNKVVNVALLGGGFFAAYKLITALSSKQDAASRNARRSVRRGLNAELARVAEANKGGALSSRNARPRARRSRPLRRRLDETELHTWFERDRAHVELRDAHTGQTILEWWDEEVERAIEDGFLPHRWTEAAAHAAAFDYAKHLGLIEEGRDAGTSARTRGPKTYALQLSKGEIEALQFLKWRYSSAKALVDGLVPIDDSADRALSGEFDRNAGPYRFHIRAADVRKVLRATQGDGGDYGAIPNLRSDTVAWVLAEEAGRPS